MIKIADSTMPRRKVSLAALALGIGFGFANMHLGVRFEPEPALLAWALASLLLVIALHEATHAGVARLLGHRALFGVKLPLVYVTFDVKIPRRDFFLIALAPLILLDFLFVVIYWWAPAICPSPALRLVALLCFEINTLGAAGDVWMALSLVSYPSTVLVEDTKNGFAVWQP